ncbi:DUF6266 family protein [Butyricimonas paravirosa]
MAKFKSPLGVVQGGYGNLVTYCVKGQNRVRSKPLEYHDANTPEQQKARRRICIVSRFYSKLKETPIIDIWRVAAIPTPYDRYSLFRKVNTNVFLPNGKIGDFSNLHMAQGTLPQVLNMQIAIDLEDNVTLTWTNHLEYITSYDNSRLGIIAIYSHRSFRPRLLEGISATRKDQKAVFHVDRKTANALHLYVFFSSPEKNAYSNDQYFKLTFE